MSAEHEVDRAEQTASGPDKVPFEGLFHVEHGKGDEDGQGDHFLQNFELGQAEHGEADAVGGHHDQVFAQGDAPACQGGEQPGRAGKVFEVPVPGKGHEDVGTDQQTHGDENWREGRHGWPRAVGWMLFFPFAAGVKPVVQEKA